MKRTFTQFLFTIIAILVLIGGVPAALNYSQAAPIASEWNGQSVIVQGVDVDQVARLVQNHGGLVTSRLDVIQGVGALIPFNAIGPLSMETGITRISRNSSTHLTGISFDGKGKPTPETDYPDVIGADLAWQNGITGEGVTVAVLDTGIGNHPFFQRSLDGKPNKLIVGWVDFVDGKRHPVDPNGHGTHISGIIANTAKGTDGEWNGVAPGVNLVGVRVLDETGAGTYEKVIQGIQWVLENKDRYNIRVMNLSLHALVQSPYWADPLNQAVMRAWAEGITVVVAAGNEGPQPMSISVPGNNPYVITVGAFTDAYTPTDWSDDTLAPFSAAGPTLDGFVKPDLLAPGAHITSTMLPGSYIARNHAANWVDGFYFSMAGTSQAAAVVSGASALMLNAKPSLTPDQLKFRLMLTSLVWVDTDQNDVLYSIWQQGAGRVNAYDAALAPDVQGTANHHMDIWADLNGTQHFEGFSYYDETARMFRLRGYESSTSGYGAWAGGYGAWADGYGAWADGYGAWADGYGAWADGYGAWADGYGAWADGYGAWAGGYGAWAGGYGAWAGGYGAWADGYGAWAGRFTEPAFVESFMNGQSPDISTSTASLNWVKEP